MPLTRQVAHYVYSVDVPICEQCKIRHRRQKVLGIVMAVAALIGCGGVAYGLAVILKDVADSPIILVIGLFAALAAAALVAWRSERNPPARYKVSFSWGQPPPPKLVFRSNEFQQEFDRMNAL